MKEQATAAEIILAIVDNMEESLEPLMYRYLAPALYEVYLHPEDFERLKGVFPVMAEEARQALDDRLERLNQNAKPPRLLRPLLRAKRIQKYERAESGWFITFHKNGDEEVHDIVIESHLTMPSSHGHGGGAKTKRIVTLRSGGETRKLRSTYESAPTRTKSPSNEQQITDQVLARIHYQDQQGPNTYLMTKDEIVVGRGGIDYWVDLKLHTTPDVSREHLRLRRDRKGRFFIKDLSTQGTSVDNKPIPSSIEVVGEDRKDRDRWSPLPERARITLAGGLVLQFEAESEKKRTHG